MELKTTLVSALKGFGERVIGGSGEKSNCSSKSSNSQSFSSPSLPANISQQLNLLFEAVGQKIEARVSLPVIFSLDSSTRLSF